MKDIIHTGISVSDLEMSIVFYRDILGLKLIKREPVRTARGEKLGVPGAVIRLAVMQVGESNHTIELIEFINPKEPVPGGRGINIPATVHIAFKVDDIDEKINEMKEAGVRFVSDDYETIQDGPLKGMKWIYFQDPDGTNLELIEYVG